MNSVRPLLSVVIPTRNRPDLLAYALQSVETADSDNVEIVVADNPTTTPARDVFDKYARANWKYVKPDTPLSMSDNWEFGLQATSGTYVSFMTDKMTFLDGAISYICGFLRNHRTEILNWSTDLYSVPDQNLKNGFFKPAWQVGQAVEYDPKATLQSMAAMLTPTGQEGRRYYWGKICFGAYHRDLINRIQSKFGRMFFEVSPDFTSTVLALSLAERTIDLGRPMMLAFLLPGISNGMLTTRSSAATLRFYSAIRNGDDLLAQLPIPELYMSTHNSLTRDFQAMEKHGAYQRRVDKNYSQRFAFRVGGDLDQIFWDNSNDSETAYLRLHELFKESGVNSKFRDIYQPARPSDDFAQQMASYTEGLRKELTSSSVQYRDMPSANRAASKHYLSSLPSVNREIGKFDITDIDRMRATVGPYACLLIDHLVLRATQDKTTERTLNALCVALTKNLEASEPPSFLSTTVGKYNETLFAALIYYSLRFTENSGLIPSIWNRIKLGTLTPQDLVGTTLFDLNEINKAEDEEMCLQLRWGATLERFLPYLSTSGNVGKTDLLFLYCFVNRYSALDEQSLTTFFRAVGDEWPGRNVENPVALWTGSRSVRVEEDNSSEDLLIAAKHRISVQDWAGLLALAELIPANNESLEIYSDGYRAIAHIHLDNVDDFEKYCEQFLTRSKGADIDVEWQCILLSHLGGIRKKVGRLGEAEKILFDALARARASYGERDWRIIQYLLACVDVSVADNPDRAMDLQREVYVICKETFGTENAATQIYRQQLIDLSRRLGGNLPAQEASSGIA